MSIIKPIQRITKSEIIYFADQKNYPYGKKSKSQLKKIIIQRINQLEEKFNPDMIVIGSNTPTLLLNNLMKKNIIGVLPPLKSAQKISKNKNIAILATKSVIESKELTNYIRTQRISTKIQILKINASSLVELVESGDFISKPQKCVSIIKKVLCKKISENNIDVVTLSSTHLPFLKKFLTKEFPQVKFLDPGNDIAQIVKKKQTKKMVKNKLCIYTSSDVKKFQKQLSKIGIYNKVNFFS